MRAKAALSRELVVSATLALAEHEGVEAISMRRVGGELGVAGMAVYHYFATKDDLLEAVAERLLAELELSPQASAGATWQDEIREVVHAWARLAALHPKAFPLLYRQRRLTATDLIPAARIVGALHAAGFSTAATALGYRTILTFIDAVILDDPTGSDDTSQLAWRHLSPALAQEYPMLARHARALTRVTSAAVFAHGLDMLLVGLEAVRTG
jgi:AcrR family transcriptional regulator